MHDNHEIRPPGDRNSKRITRERFIALREVMQSDPDIGQLREEAPQRLQAVQERLGVHRLGGQQKPSARRSFRGLSRALLTMGAGVLAGLAIFSVYGMVTSKGTRPSVSVTTYTTGMGERAAVILPDGSHVILAPGTRLRDFSSSAAARNLELEGEAFFTVVTSPDAPFTVASGDLQTSVLGTSFLIRRYEHDSVAQVAVVTGRVSTSRTLDGTPVVLTPGTVVTVTDSSMTVRQGQDVKRMAAWTDGTLIFDETPVPVMLATIGRWYGYEFQLADSTLTTRHVSMVFRTDQRVEAMEKIRAVLGVTMTFDGQVVTLRPGHASSNTLHRRSPLSPVTTGVGK